MGSVTKQALRDLDIATKHDIADLETRMTKTFVTWLIASQAVTLTAVGILVGALLAVG